MDEKNYSLYCPFWIDTDGYTDRDRLMFCCGVEFKMLLDQIAHEPEGFTTVIMRENESRIRMAAARFGRKCKVEQCEHKDDPQQQWSYVVVEAMDE